MDELRTILKASLGRVLSLDKEAPGIWFLASRKTEKSFTTEYYLVEQSSEIISDQAKTYGAPVEGHPECREHEMLNYAALKNVLCNKYTDYALQVNQRALEEKQFFAQRGMDTTGMPDKLLACVPGAGFDFLKF